MANIKSAQVVSDGILVVFSDNTISYFEGNTLYTRRRELACQDFLDHDPDVAITSAEYLANDHGLDSSVGLTGNA